MFLSLLAIPAALPAQTGGAANWVPLTENDQGPISIDTRSVERDGSRVAAWYRTDLRQPGENNEIVWMDRREVDCDARTIRLLAFSERRADGSTAASNPDVNGQAGPIQPNSVGAAMYDHLCK
jgi:hypothetical protein